MDDGVSVGLSDYAAPATVLDDGSLPMGTAAATPYGHGDAQRSQAGGGRRWRLSRLGLGAVLAALLTVAIVALANRKESPPPIARPSPQPTAPAPEPTPTSPPPPPPAFSFEDVTVRTTAVSSVKNHDAAVAAAQSVATSLSGFYDRAFLEQQTWSAGPPDDLWDVFSESLRTRARSDAASFSLGSAGPSIRTLEVSTATITATVLLDSGGHPTALLADVRFEAIGELEDGRGLDLTNRATYLFRPSGGSWLIAGYPDVRTDLKRMPAPSPSGAQSESPQASPASSP